MSTKKLYIFVNDGGDGSFSLRYTFDENLIKLLEERSNDLSYEDPGVDGDGLNYNILSVPVECTYESLGISKYSILEKDDFSIFR